MPESERRSLIAAARRGPSNTTPKVKVTEVELANGPATIVSHPNAKVPGTPTVKPEITCADCLRRKAADKRQAEQQQAAADRRQREAEKHKVRQARFAQQGRLPAGSYFGECHWDGTCWTGSLSVPVTDVLCQRFDATESSLSRLHHELDAQYRTWLAAQAGKEEESHV